MRAAVIAFVAMLGVLSSVLAAAFDEVDAGGRTLVVTAETDLESLGLGRGSIERMREILGEVSDAHRLEVQVSVVPRIRTGYDQDMHFSTRITALDAQGRRDGPEREYSNWYQPAWRRATYKAGEPHGVEQHFTPNGATLQVEIPWENGAIHGMRRTFHPDGSVQTETPYENGEIQGLSRTYDRHGRVIRTVNFKDGRRHGESIDYWPENPEQIQRVIPYVEGQVHGIARAYYLDGTRSWERPFVENNLHGVERHYDSAGEPRRETYWLDNERVSEDAWAAAGSP